MLRSPGEGVPRNAVSPEPCEREGRQHEGGGLALHRADSLRVQHFQVSVLDATDPPVYFPGSLRQLHKLHNKCPRGFETTCAVPHEPGGQPGSSVDLGRASLTSGYGWAAGEPAGGWRVEPGLSWNDSNQFRMASPPPAGLTRHFHRVPWTTTRHVAELNSEREETDPTSGGERVQVLCQRAWVGALQN